MYCNKSAITIYNNNLQVVGINGEVQFPSNCTKTGCSLSNSTSSITVNNSGLYTFSFDAFGVGTTAGIVTFQLYKDGVAVPCAQDAQTVAVGDTRNFHFNTTLFVPVCCCESRHTFTVVATTTGITLNHAKFSVVKEA